MKSPEKNIPDSEGSKCQGPGAGRSGVCGLAYSEEGKAGLGDRSMEGKDESDR